MPKGESSQGQELELVFFERFQQYLASKNIEFEAILDDMTVYVQSQNETAGEHIQVRFVGEIEIRWVYGYQVDFYGALDSGIRGFDEITSFFDQFIAGEILFSCRLDSQDEIESGTPCPLDEVADYGPITDRTVVLGWSATYVGKEGRLQLLASRL